MKSENEQGLLALSRRVWRAMAARVTSPAVIGSRVLSYRASSAGIPMTADEALKISAVWACVNYLGKTVGQLPWKVYLKQNDKRIEQSTNPVQRLLSTRPNPEMTAIQFRQTMTSWAALYGNAVAEIEWDGRWMPKALWPVHPDRVTPMRATENGEMVIAVSNSAGQVQSILRMEDVLHVPGYGDGPWGLSVFEYAADSLGWARATEIFSGAVFGRGARPSGVVKHKRKLSEDALDALKSEFKQLYAGPRNAANIMFLDDDMDWKEIPANDGGGDFVSTRQHQVEEICRWFGVPPHKIQHLLRATFSNIEHQSIEVVVDAITPWVLKFEQEADAKLFSPRTPYYTKLDLKGLMRGDYASRQAGLQIQRRNGIINADEWRAIEDMDPIGGKAGTQYIVESNMQPADKIGEPPPEPKAKPQPKQGKEGVEDEGESEGEGSGGPAEEGKRAA